jgi:hypothetical protein
VEDEQATLGEEVGSEVGANEGYARVDWSEKWGWSIVLAWGKRARCGVRGDRRGRRFIARRGSRRGLVQGQGMSRADWNLAPRFSRQWRPAEPAGRIATVLRQALSFGISGRNQLTHQTHHLPEREQAHLCADPYVGSGVQGEPRRSAEWGQ